MSRSTDKLIDTGNEKLGVKPTKKSKAPAKPLISWINNDALPSVAIGVVVLATAYTAVVLVGKLSMLPEQAQGAVALVAVAFVTSKAIKKLNK